MTQLYDTYMDLFVYPGTDLDFSLQLIPEDLTATAVLIVDQDALPAAFPGSPFTVTCSNGQIGVIPYLLLSLSVPGATTANWVPGTYDYRCITTLSDGSIDVACRGVLTVETL